MHVVQTPITAERVVEGEDYAVELTIDPADLIPQILAALGSSALLLGQAARWRNSNSPEARADALRIILSHFAVDQACRIRVPGGDADDLATQLDEACGEPDRCRASDCDNYCLDKADHCPIHVDGMPVGLRAV